MSGVVMATDAQFCHISWILPLLCVHTHIHAHTSKQCVLERFPFLFLLFIFSSIWPVVLVFVVVVIVACE